MIVIISHTFPVIQYFRSFIHSICEKSQVVSFDIGKVHMLIR